MEEKEKTLICPICADYERTAENAWMRLEKRQFEEVRWRKRFLGWQWVYRCPTGHWVTPFEFQSLEKGEITIRALREQMRARVNKIAKERISHIGQ